MAQIHPYTRNTVWTHDNDNDGGSGNDNGGDKQNADWYHILDKKNESTRVCGVLPARRGRYLGSLNLSQRETMMADIPRHITTLR